MSRKRVSPSPAVLEKLGFAAIRVVDGAVRRAIVWAILGGAIGIVLDLACWALFLRGLEGEGTIATSWVVAMMLALPALGGVLFGIYGAEAGFFDAGFEAEKKLGIVRWLVDQALVPVEERFGSSFRGVPRDEVDEAIEAGSTYVLGMPDSSWKGLWGMVARIVHAFLARRFETALIHAHLAVATEVGEEGDVRLDEVARRGRDAIHGTLEGLAATLLRIEFMFLFAGMLALGIGWYPIASKVIAIFD